MRPDRGGVFVGDAGCGGRGRVYRRGLVESIRTACHRFVVLLAPSGYGKTTVAEQVVSEGFDARFWIELSGESLGDGELLTLLIAELAGCSQRRVPLASPGDRPPAGRGSLHEAMSDLGVSRVAFVLDDLCFCESTVADLVKVARAGRDAAVEILILVTSRCTDYLGRVTPHALVILPELLRFSTTETRQLLCDSGYGDVPDDVVEDVLAFTNGQPALVALSLPHILRLRELGEQKRLSEWRFDSIAQHLRWIAATQLNPEERTALRVAALLGKGDTAQLTRLHGRIVAGRLRSIADVVPLLYLDEGELRFEVHSLAQDAFLIDDSGLMTPGEAASVTKRVLRELDAERRHLRLLAVLRALRDPRERCEAIVEHGDGLLARGLLTGVLDCLQQIPASVMLTSPHAVFLMARALYDLGRREEALARAAVARSLACAEADDSLASQVSLFIAEASAEAGELEKAERALSEALKTCGPNAPPDSRVRLLGYHAVCAALSGKRGACETSLAAMRSVEQGTRLHRGTVAQMRFYEGTVAAFADGDWSLAGGLWMNALMDDGVPEALRLSIQGNIGAAYCETGRLRQCDVVISEVLDRAEELGYKGHYNCFLSVKGAAAAARQEYDSGTRIIRDAIERNEAEGLHVYADQDRLYLACILRAMGALDESLVECEIVFQHLLANANPFLRNGAFLETAATKAALGERDVALRLVDRLEHEVGGSLGRVARLKIELIRCACATIAGFRPEVDGNEGLVEFVASGSANWQLAMYSRSFPDILPALAAVVGDGLPSSLRAMTSQTTASSERAPVIEARGAMAAAAAASSARCGVFGGFEVHTNSGSVSRRAWRKRKARLLFAMLIVKRGQDVPREQILDHLWPDMDAERARNNFYVAWSAMKSALMGGAGQRAQCPYVESVGGVCRVVKENVRTDLDEFDEQLETARRAEDEGASVDALAAYKRLIEIYQGDLLPGDLYDDWFTGIREQYRRQFSDAMLRAGRLQSDAGRPDDALRMTRAALAFDAWREDLYQAAIRYQMSAGQRGAAIETYMTCREKLAEDLGLDPSAEMRRLYDDILAMEDGPNGVVA